MYQYMLLTAKYGEEFKSLPEWYLTYAKALKAALALRKSGLQVKLLTQREDENNKNCFRLIASADVY